MPNLHEDSHYTIIILMGDRYYFNLTEILRNRVFEQIFNALTKYYRKNPVSEPPN